MNKILYNVTVAVEPGIERDWVQWMTDVHIPDVMKTGCFETCRMSKLLEPNEGGPTYAMQYLASDMATLQRYQTEFGPALKKDAVDRYGDKMLAFRTIMEVVQEFSRG